MSVAIGKRFGVKGGQVYGVNNVFKLDRVGWS